MICDKIIYDGQVILTIFHDYNSIDTAKRHYTIKEKIREVDVVFNEDYCENKSVEIATEKSEDLLSPNDPENPYSGHACALMIHYVNYDKPSKIFKIDGKKYSMKISIDDFMFLNNFVELQTGIKISQKPMMYGDTLIYKCHEVLWSTIPENGIKIESIPVHAVMNVSFKQGTHVVFTKIYNGKEGESKELISDRPWNNLDVNVYLDNCLYFFQHDIKYMKTARLQMVESSVRNKVKLNKIGTTYAVWQKSKLTESYLGAKPKEEAKQVSDIEAYLLEQIELKKKQTTVMFIKLKETHKALDEIGKMLQSAEDEIWLFDSYFSDISLGGAMIDWLRIIEACPAKIKNIAFQTNNNKKILLSDVQSIINKIKKSTTTVNDINTIINEIINKGKTSAYDTSTIVDAINKDDRLAAVIRAKGQLGINLFQIRSYIHDRFILIRNGAEYSGLTIGTSLNSVDNNYFCITHLDGPVSEDIWHTLVPLTDHANVVSETAV